MSVLDASVLLAFAQGEEGAAQTQKLLEEGAVCGAANWSEVAQKVRAAGRDWDLVRALLVSYNLTVEAVIEADAEWSALRWRKGEGLSLADRLCLALGERLDAEVWTADTSWGTSGRIHQLR
jgi:ribonuclease VapC